MNKRWVRSMLGVAAFVCCASWIAPETKAAVSFPKGEDCWATNAGSTTVNLGNFPAGAFNCAPKTSLAFNAGTIGMSGAPPLATCDCAPPTMVWVNSHGSVVNPGDNHAVGQVAVPATGDTCVKRKSSAVLNTGVPTAIPIEITALHLRSTNPLAVPMSDATTCLYQIDVTLDGSTQAQGSITLTPGADPHNGTVNLTSLPVGSQLTYTPLNGCCAHTQAPGSDTFTNSTGTFHVPDSFPSLTEIGAGALVGLILLGMIVVLWRRRTSVEA